MCDLKKGLITWYEIPGVNRNWLQFKTHFTEAQEVLCRVCGPTMQSGFLNQQANLISLQMIAKIQQERLKYLNAVSALEERILKAFGY